MEKALDRLRANDPKSKDEQRSDNLAALDEGIKRMRAHRLRLERNQRPTKTK